MHKLEWLILTAGLLAHLGCQSSIPEEKMESRDLEDLLPDSPVDSDLQAMLIRKDHRLATELGIPLADRAFGVLDLEDDKLAWIRPDAQFYGASVPKICILLAFLEQRSSEDLDPGTIRELQLMIKRSSNEMAAKYSQIVGLKNIQNLQRSPRYRLYDPETGGGLWCGKHYGIEEPRTGDPVGDYSHAATVRQCLRFYLMLERGELVSPTVSKKIKEIFAAPELEFHDSNFIRGLNGRDVTVIRKNGLWEDWHLDTARVENAGRAYLLAGMVRHTRGGEYLAGLAAAIDRHLGGEDLPLAGLHELRLHDEVPDFAAGTVQGGHVGPEGVEFTFGESGEDSWFESVIMRARHPFNEVLPSWNVEVPEDTGFSVELRVGHRFAGTWSPWLYVGGWGIKPTTTTEATEFEEGKILTDYFHSDRRYDLVQYRVRVEGSAAAGRILRIRRVALNLSDRTGIPHTFAATRPVREPLVAADWTAHIDVPFRSQKAEDPTISRRICSPTSVAMVLHHRGVNRPTAEVAERMFDREHGIYGNWPRAVQAAFTYGVPGYVARFSDWIDVRALIVEGTPIIASIAVQSGELTGAPYSSTDGHLLVVTGFDGPDGVRVNDPAARTEDEGRAVYDRRELEKVWMGRGGTAYVLLPRED